MSVKKSNSSIRIITNKNDEFMLQHDLNLIEFYKKQVEKLQEQLRASEIENYNLKIENQSLKDHFRVMSTTNEEFLRMLNQSKDDNRDLKQENETLKATNQSLTIEIDEVRLMLRNKTIQIQNFEDKLEEEQAKFMKIMKELKAQKQSQINDDNCSLKSALNTQNTLKKRRAKSLIYFVPIENQGKVESSKIAEISCESRDSQIYGHVTTFLWSTLDLEYTTMKHVFNYVFQYVPYQDINDKVLMKKKIRQIVENILDYM